MPPPLHGSYRYPGVRGAANCTYTLSHGISPGRAVIELAPQNGLVDLDGVLELAFGALRLRFPGMRADLATALLTGQGYLLRIELLDRRWRWLYGEINGHWNARGDNNLVPPHLVRSPRQLATACLLAMGEAGFDVSQLPDETFPAVEWDRANPAQQLADLCEALGCRVVLTLANTVRICRAGVGGALPTDGLKELQTGQNPPERPDKIKFVGGKARFQNDWLLSAVGTDLDGSTKRINDLSYKPSGGWSKQDPLFFAGVEEGRARELAKRTVFRRYRLANLNYDNTKPLKLPGTSTRLDYGHQVELEDVQCDTYADRQRLTAAGFAPEGATTLAGSDKDDVYRSLPAEVYGIFYDGGLSFENTDDHTLYRGSFRVIQQEQLIEFDKAVLIRNADGTLSQADLYLRAAATIKDPLSFTPVRYERELTFPGPQLGTGAKILRHDEVVAQFAADYDPTTGKLLRIRDNTAECNQAADYWLAAAQLEYQTPAPTEATYAGLKAISPDGAIQQVTWIIDKDRGTTTRASRNNEFSTRVPSYADRRFDEKLRGDALLQIMQQLKEQREKLKKKKS